MHRASPSNQQCCRANPSRRRKPVNSSRRIAAKPVACSLSAANSRMALPRAEISLVLRRRSRGVLASLRTPLAGLSAIRPCRTACSKMACRVEMVRAATPSPPVVAPPRLPALALAVFPRAMSACMPSMSLSVSAFTRRLPRSGRMWLSTRLWSMARVDALMGRRRRPRIRPSLASSRYQSQISATVCEPVSLACSAAGSTPFETATSFSWAISRACSTVISP